MKRDTLFAVGLLGLSALLLPARVLLGIEIAPASARDILSALGPDASGLRISQDTLPDLFALTASRIEEDPKQFTVEQPYLSGRWKGGRAVIEYARDLSYTLVSVYDKNGHRQRIYSVKTAFNDHTAHPTPQAESAEPSTNEEGGWGRQASPTSQPSRSENALASRGTSASASSAAGAPSNVSFEWDDTRGVYVPVSMGAVVSSGEETPSAKAGTPSTNAKTETTSTHRRRRHHRGDETTVASAQTFTPAPAKKSSLPAPMQDSGIWLPSAEKTKTSSSASRTMVKAGNSTWMERREDSGTPESAPRKKKHKRVESETTVAQASTPETTKASDEWVPKSIQETPVKSKQVEVDKHPVVAVEVPSEEELLGTSAPSPSQPASSVSAPAEKPSRRHRRKAPAAEQQAPPQESAPATAPAPASAPAVVSAPSPSVRSEPEPARVASSKTSAAPVPSTEDLVATPDTKTGPDTAESDKWVPKATPKPSVREPEVPETSPEPMKVAMVPKSTPVDNSVDNLLKMANTGKEEMPKEGDTWVPKKTATVSPELDINKEISRVREEERKKEAVPKPVVQVRRDVNNPEEGVLPVSSFEKFSGPMYGRHREYERRFYPGRKSKSKAPEHDFYVDEVDRKKEIHNVYYYTHQKGKAPRLVAVERHDKVSFMGNYDIDKEDKGKISTYN